ncbi:MAG TPA: cytochrome c oxidase subunit II [Noviherbaspirillum sp.]
MRCLVLVLLSIMPLVARGEIQSAFDPQGIDSARIAEISNVMFVGGGLILAGVVALAAIALFGTGSLRRSIGRHGFIIAGGIVFPVVVLSALLVYAMFTSAALVRAESPPALRVEVSGEVWWWRVRYLGKDGHPLVETANEIRIPAGQPVELLLRSADVIHSFWVPNLAGKLDMIPGHVNSQRLQADRPGIFRGQCAEYCGAQHANMAFHVIALAPEEFEAWLAAQTQPAREPQEELPRRGRAVFLANDCVKCHTVRGTPAAGRDGPDLTHVGSRASLAAGVLSNSTGAFGGWISASQHIKPGNKMPSFDRLASEDLRAIAAYMESLQ